MRKYILLWAVILAVVLTAYLWPVHAATSTLTGLFKDASGNPINGYVLLQLPVPAVDTATNTSIPPTPLRYSVVNGVLQTGPPVFDVAGLQPQNLYYQETLYDNSGTKIMGANVIITGASFNLSAAIPTQVTTNNVSYVNPAITTGPNTFCCTQTFTGQIISSLATGTAPFAIASTTLVPNLNINNLNSVIVSGTPSINQTIVATSPTAASWQTPSSAIFGTYPNDTVTGTVAGLITKLSGAPSKAITTGLADTGGAIGICVSGCGTSGSASISTVGMAACTFDGATTAGDYVQISSTTAGNCHDSGVSYPTAGQAVGRVLTTNVGGGSYNVALFATEIRGNPAQLIIKTGRNSSVCSTGAGAGASCTTTITWNSGAFADTNYEASCSGIGPTQFPFYTGITSQLAASVTVQITNGTASEAQISTFSSISCIGIHN